VAPLQRIADLLWVEWELWDECERCPASNTGAHRNVPDVASHHLHHNDAIVGFCCGVQTINRRTRHVHRSVEPKGQFGRINIVIDRFRHSDARDSVGSEVSCRSK
jgi:hypothetical protein